MDISYNVTGMSCGHCEAAVREEVGAVTGVDAVEVDLATGEVVVRGEFDVASVREAIEEAGYEVAG